MIGFHARAIRKSYGKRLILDLDLHFESRGLHVILGPNGCGKSTLLKLLALQESPDQGDILLLEDGQDLEKDRSNRQRIVLTPQPGGLFNDTVRNNAAYGLKVRNVARKERTEGIDAVLSAVGLSPLGGANALTLSSGEKQRLCMAMAMAVTPDVILLDEPTSSLDPHNVQQVEAIIADMKRERRMIILVTHNISQARRLADSVTFMATDRAVVQSPAAEFFANFDEDGLDGYL
ncbi:MAG: ATP-binding cassette domain-containing protein [Thermodesulfobacteriota bacterium]